MRPIVINLDREPGRLAQFRARNPGLDFERFPAIDGEAQGWDDPAIGAPSFYSARARGCALSHIALWRHAVGLGSPLTIIEDDAAVADDADRVVHWPGPVDFLLWGCNFDAPLAIGCGLSAAVVRFDQAELRRRLAGGMRPSGRAALFRLSCAFGTPAYRVTPRGAAKLLDLVLPLTDRRVDLAGIGGGIPNIGIDCALNAVYPRIEAYAAFPPLAVTPNEKTAEAA